MQGMKSVFGMDLDVNVDNVWYGMVVDWVVDVDV